MIDLGGPELLGDFHTLDAFDCGAADMDTWLKHRARRNQSDGSSRTWVVAAGRSVVGYYASSTAVLLRASATTRMARNQPGPLPALLLGRLAVDHRWQGQSLAAALLKHFLMKSLEVAELTGVRILLVHARNTEAAEFYLRYGFEPSPVDDLTLMLLVKDLHA